MPHAAAAAAAANRALLVEKGQWWRLVTSLFASDSFAEGLLSWFLLYKFRLFERQMGCVPRPSTKSVAGCRAREAQVCIKGSRSCCRQLSGGTD
jgi:hypothetical protein